MVVRLDETVTLDGFHGSYLFDRDRNQWAKSVFQHFSFSAFIFDDLHKSKNLCATILFRKEQ